MEGAGSFMAQMNAAFPLPSHPPPLSTTRSEQGFYSVYSELFERLVRQEMEAFEGRDDEDQAKSPPSLPRCERCVCEPCVYFWTGRELRGRNRLKPHPSTLGPFDPRNLWRFEL
jgi:hypothetical protein